MLSPALELGVAAGMIAYLKALWERFSALVLTLLRIWWDWVIPNRVYLNPLYAKSVTEEVRLPEAA
jgi:hypothetical protein